MSPIMVVPKKNGKLRICVNFRKLNATTKKDPYPLPFTDEVINIVVGHKVYTFMDGFSRFISINYSRRLAQNHLCDSFGGFCLGCDAIWCQKWTTHLSKASNKKNL
jgi:hypothetical protein